MWKYDVSFIGLATYPAQLQSKRDCFAKSNSSSFTQSLDPDFHVNKLLYQDLLLQTTSSTITNCKQDPSSSFEVSAPVVKNTFDGMGKVSDTLLNNSVMKLGEMVDRPSIGPPEQGNSVRKQFDNFGQNIHSDRGNMGIELHGRDMDSGVGKNPLMASDFSDDISDQIINFQQLQGVIGQVCCYLYNCATLFVLHTLSLVMLVIVSNTKVMSPTIWDRLYRSYLCHWALVHYCNYSSFKSHPFRSLVQLPNLLIHNTWVETFLFIDES